MPSPHRYRCVRDNLPNEVAFELELHERDCGICAKKMKASARSVHPNIKYYSATIPNAELPRKASHIGGCVYLRLEEEGGLVTTRSQWYNLAVALTNALVYPGDYV